MNKITAILVSFIILFQSFSIEVADFGKVSTLMEHFTCHIEAGDTFANFISMHYGSQLNIHKNEHNEHKELPFKHEHLEVHIQLDYIFYDHHTTINFEGKRFVNKNFSYKEPSTDLYINNLFQPPQKLHSSII